MDGAFPDACVRGWRPLVPGVSVRDPQDAHVVAAALSGRADVIVTFNTKDFEADFLASQGLEVQHPDVFLANQLDLDPDATMIALPRQACGKVNPRMSLPELLTSLERCQVGDFARAARGQIWRT